MTFFTRTLSDRAEPNHVSFKRILSRFGFTLVELLAVIAIVGILAAILIPTVARIRDRAAQSKCLSSLRSAYVATQLYASENKGQIVPGSVKTPADTSAKLWSTTLVPYYGQENNAASATFACPKWEDDKVSASAYNWGYAMNLTPAYEGAGSTDKQKAASVIDYKADGSYTGTIFRFSTITQPGKRLFFADSYQWHVRGSQVAPGNPGQTLAAYNRHGDGKCNVIFFDGHATTLTPAAVDQAIYDPSAPSS